MAFFDFLHIFTDLFNSIEREWHKVPADVQNALKHGSGIIKIITDNPDQSPEDKLKEIIATYPDVEASLNDGLTALAKFIGVEAGDSILTIANIMKYYDAIIENRDTSRSIWAQILGFLFSPNGTPFGMIVSWIEYVFRKKVK